MRVIVTRPREQADAAVEALRAAGVDAVALPLIRIAPPADPTALDLAWQSLGTFALVMFVSANAVLHFFARWPQGEAWPPGMLAGATGPGTAKALRAAGVPLPAIVVPADEPFDSEALWQLLRTRTWAGQRVMIVRGDGGRDWLAEQLRETGASVQTVAAYRRMPPDFDAAQRTLLAQALAQPKQHLWALSSAEALAHLNTLVPKADWSAGQAIASHPRIAEAARSMGFGHVQAGALDVASLVRSIQSMYP